MRNHRRRKLRLRFRRDRWLCLGQQLSLGEPRTSDNQLPTEDSTLFHGNGFGGYVAIEHRPTMNNDRSLRDDFAGHLASNLDAFDPDTPEELHDRFSLNQNVFRCEPSGDLAGKIDRGRAQTVQVAAQFAFD